MTTDHNPEAPPVDLTAGHCVDDDPSQWDGQGTSYAHHVCLGCPVREACRNDALENERGQDGMRGNMWFDEGRLRPIPTLYQLRDRARQRQKRERQRGNL